MAQVGGGAPEALVPPATEQEVAVYKQAKTRAISELFQNNLPQFRNQFNDLEYEQNHVQQEELHNRELRGSLTDEDRRSLANQRLQQQIWTRETLENLRNPPNNRNRDDIYNELGINRENRNILNGFITRLHSGDVYEDFMNAPILYKALNSALNNLDPNPFNILTDDDFAQLARQNSNLHDKLAEALFEAARANGVQAKDLTEFETKRSREMQTRRRGGSYTEDEFRKKFAAGTPEDEEAIAFYEAINLGDIDKFTAYYQNKIAESMRGIDAFYRPRMQAALDAGQLTEESFQLQIREAAAKSVTHDIHEIILYTTNTIFNEALAKGPEETFQKVARELGGYMADPTRVFEEMVAGNLSALSTRAQRLVNTPKQQGDYYVFKRESKPGYDPETGRGTEQEVPTAVLVKDGIDRFVESLRVIAKEERGALEYQFNLGYLMKHPEHAITQNTTFMQTMSGMARQSFTANTIDNLYMLPHNEMIQAAVMSLEHSYKELFHEHEWRKTADLDHEMFVALPKAESNALAQLLNSFSGKPEDGKIPAWAVTRAFYHAKAMSFGKEFMFQLLTSYADPYLNEEGTSTYIGEGHFHANSIFDIFADGKRWGEGTDPYAFGAITMPQNVKIDRFYPIELQKEGERRWRDSFDHGDMAYFDSPVFKDKDGRPILSVTNFTQMHGVDGYSGWRVKYTYTQWIDEIVNPRNISLQTEFHGNPALQEHALTYGWKSLENIGVNVIKNYSEEFLWGGIEEKNGRIVYNEAQHKDFFKYLYSRYFGANSVIGSAFYSGETVDNHPIRNADDFWNYIKKSTYDRYQTRNGVVGALQHHIYNAMTVMLHERTPLEFLFMERRRSSQNGVVLTQELKDYFIDGPEGQGGAWRESPDEAQAEIIEHKWHTAIDDLKFIQGEARRSSIQQMKERVETAPDKHKMGLLYGDDLNAAQSEIRYKIDSVYIREQLDRRLVIGREGITEESKRSRIDRAVQLYEKMNERLREKPRDGELEVKWRADNPAKYAQAREWMRKRATWFSDTWREKDFGMEFTADSAGQFLNRSAVGDDVVARVAEAVSVVTESTKGFTSGKYRDAIVDAVNKGKDGWEGLVDGIKDVYKSCKNEDAAIGKRMTRHLVNWAMMAMRVDSRTEDPMGRAAFVLKKRPTSVAAKWVKRGPAHDMNAKDRFDFVSLFARSILEDDTSHPQFKEVAPKNAWQKVKCLVTGKKTVLERDFSNEISAEAILGINKATKGEVRWRYGLQGATLLALALVYFMLKKATEDS